MHQPDFIGIGVQRAATTWIYRCLLEHPEIFVPEVKEVHFFDENYKKGMAWYLDFFVPAGDVKAVGEITPNYINVPGALERIARDLPDVRIFLILREPISRAYSAYRLLNEKYGHLSFQEACESTDYFLSLSCYADDLERLYRLFPSNQIKFFLYEDVRERPRELLRDLFQFLNVDPEFVPASVDKVYNSIIMPGVQNIFMWMGLSGVVEMFKSTPLGQQVKSLLVSLQARRSGTKTSISGNRLQIEGVSPDYINHLKEFFRDDILRVQEVVNRDLSDWL